MEKKPNAVTISFYRKVFLCHLIDEGVNTVPRMIKHTYMAKRTVEDVLSKLHEIDIKCVHKGTKINGGYVIESWGLIDKAQVKQNIEHIRAVLVSAIEAKKQ